MKVYTRAGDRGTTRLVSGEEVRKDSTRLDAYGTVDELGSFLGLLVQTIEDANFANDARQELLQGLRRIQHELFNLGSELATPSDRLSMIQGILLPQDASKRLEGEMDSMSEKLPELRNFTLPGGHAANALAHVCRSIARRAERVMVALNQSDPQREATLIYINRLSDWFFICARYTLFLAGKTDVIWNQRTN